MMRFCPQTDTRKSLLRVCLPTTYLLAAVLFFAGTAVAQSPTPIFPIPSIPATLDGAYIGPGRGLTRDFEIQFIENTIDRHFSALRMTELAAGTPPQRSDLRQQ